MKIPFNESYLHERVLVKPYSSKELANIYGVNKKTLHKWMEPFIADIGKKQGRFYTVAQVKIIFSRIGLPCIIE